MSSESAASDALSQTLPSSSVPVEFLTGAAGTGKTFTLKKRIEADSEYGLLTATTGIAAVNLGATTINSALGYFDTTSLDAASQTGELQSNLLHIGESYRNLIVDEVSMMDRRQLDIIYRAVQDVNTDTLRERPLGLVLTGDFCQLPPIPARGSLTLPWAFEADCWPQFESHTTTLTKHFRHSDAAFLEALNHFRAGRGNDGADILKGIVEFAPRLDDAFDGTVVFGRNDEVDRYNAYRFSKLPGETIPFPSTRWDRTLPAWKNIPDTLELKENALVMVLTNEAKTFSYVNGDTGHVRDFITIESRIGGEMEDVPAVVIELKRTGEDVVIPLIERLNTVDEPPGDYRFGLQKYVRGGIRYMPLRLAYATTCHKSQGLTLDNIQIDVRGQFFGHPAMTYVSLSRCRTAQGLRIVGSPSILASRCKIHPKVKRYL